MKIMQEEIFGPVVAVTPFTEIEEVVQASNDTMLVGSAIFAASAIVSVGLVLLTSLMARLGIGGFYLAH